MDDDLVVEPTGSDLHGEAERLRARGPAVRVRLPENIGAWAVSDFDWLRELLTDPRVSKDPEQHWSAWRRGEHRQSWARWWVGQSSMLTAYGADHRRLRRLVAPAFSARRIEALAPAIRCRTGELLEEMVATAPGASVDLRTAFAHPLPMAVICELFGIPAGDQRAVGEVFDLMMNSFDDLERAQTAQADALEIFRRLVAHKREQPGEDLTSALVSARDEDDGSRLTEQELLDTLFTMVGAGHETTVNLIGNAVHALLTHPEQLALVQAGSATWSDVVEETLRWAPSIANLPLRFAVEDIALPDGSGTIREGEAILPAYAAAGRSPDKHGPDAHVFDLTRAEPEHLAFGHGVHFCLGAPLARMEGRIALSALFERFPRLRLATAPEHIPQVPSWIAHGHRRLPVLLT
ncbi:cytochrome P450 [Streptomyces sp. NPDC007083]|uniref:cytochrome P450 family protein n=1 Tax=unclassified Streptomyces TaxID=2593676 RepID=UPI0033D8F7D1